MCIDFKENNEKILKKLENIEKDVSNHKEKDLYISLEKDLERACQKLKKFKKNYKECDRDCEKEKIYWYGAIIKEESYISTLEILLARYDFYEHK